MKSLFGKRGEPNAPESNRQACAKLDDCTFVMRHGNCPEFQIKRYKQFYCTGPRMEECARLRFFRENQYDPSEHMAPTGIIIESYRS